MATGLFDNTETHLCIRPTSSSFDAFLAVRLFLIYNMKRVSGLAWHTTTFVFLDFPLAWNVDQSAYPASTSRPRIAGGERSFHVGDTPL